MAGRWRKPKASLSESPGGTALAASRMAAGLSQEELARKFGIDRSVVEGWEAGRSWLGLSPRDRVLRARVAKMMRLYPPAITDVSDITSIV